MKRKGKGFVFDCNRRALRPTAMPESSEYTKIVCLRTRPTYAFFSGLPYWR
jgi:hypothetical protein